MKIHRDRKQFGMLYAWCRSRALEENGGCAVHCSHDAPVLYGV
jgi:hypothetical protein